MKLLQSGGSDHPMTLLKGAGVDLSQPETVRAVSAQLDGLVDQTGKRAGLIQSIRNAASGSIRIAFLAGTNAASVAIASSITGT